MPFLTKVGSAAARAYGLLSAAVAAVAGPLLKALDTNSTEFGITKK